MIWATSCPVAGPGLLGPTDQPRRRPLGMRAVGARHVLAMGGRLSVVAPPVRRQSLAAIEDLDRVRGVADLDLLADQLERHAIDVALDLDVVVDVGAAQLPSAPGRSARSAGTGAPAGRPARRGRGG